MKTLIQGETPLPPNREGSGVMPGSKFLTGTGNRQKIFRLRRWAAMKAGLVLEANWHAQGDGVAKPGGDFMQPSFVAAGGGNGRGKI